MSWHPQLSSDLEAILATQQERFSNGFSFVLNNGIEVVPVI
jgi:hypothetical protein